MDTALIALAYFSSPPPLPDPPQVQLWLLERPLFTGGALLGAALAFHLLAGRSMKKGWIGTLAIAVLAGAAYGLGSMVETDRERVLRRTEAFFEAVEAGEGEAVEAMLGESVAVALGGSTIPGMGREAIVAGVETLEQRNLRELDRQELQAVVDGETAARSQVRLRATVGGGGPNLVWVKLNWRADGREWLVTGVDVLTINGEEPGQYVRQALQGSL